MQWGVIRLTAVWAQSLWKPAVVWVKFINLATRPGLVACFVRVYVYLSATRVPRVWMNVGLDVVGHCVGG